MSHPEKKNIKKPTYKYFIDIKYDFTLCLSDFLSAEYYLFPFHFGGKYEPDMFLLTLIRQCYLDRY